MHEEPLWVLVRNETRTRIVRGRPGPGAALPPELVLRREHHRLKDIMAGKPGRSFSSGSAGRRSAMEYGADPLRADQKDFAHHVIDLLSTHVASDDFASLAVFAEPGMLGLLRELLPPALERRIVMTRSLNLVHLSSADLAHALARELRPARGADTPSGARAPR